MAKKIISQIEFEIEQIDQLFTSYDELLERARQGPPDLVELTALASVLHSFYNRLENIFLAIAKRIDVHVPSGPQSHRYLLTQMTESTTQRGPVLTTVSAHQLAEYLSFRHFYRHTYSFMLDWHELGKLVTPLAEVWKQAKGELQLFLESLSSD